ncbi:MULTISPECIES: flagellar biosynthetic protein FliR [Halorhodospira]|uniref:flagellar biosynthetic protein FliR n=1 Tax=Halorhodospira TaxID=85108 RepID=UPI0019119007|nr:MULTISPECIES: flagellar biosynthetic protein FliR [Halorhodospira]MBK5942805.1 flagellar biosynthetic protein FliR [Halorhodospira halophila]MCG5528826.1 flagellar biosynthetic protein FliR [Halorhodospira halophila]MCG5533715.1 flagellar biosynthetic protein FliR [Halorhodospira sp. 9621]MCG5538905.1 flagellar biosynthetic protein FliR [Halorhodospira sp. 9622]MCG5541184.1 flagellar biosynthetic protein FliR [Halorhodospira sp. M39old]
MEISSAEAAAWVGTFMYPLMRIGAAALVAPVFGNDMIPLQVRVFIGVALTIAVLPAVGEVPPVDPLSADGLLIAVQEVLVGLTIGMILALALNTAVIAGESIALAMGLGFATMVDPQTGMSVPVISQLLLTIVTLLFLAVGGHLMLIQLLADSFAAVPIGEIALDRDVFWGVAAWGTQMYAGAVLIALPLVTVLLVINLSLGVMTRAAPQMNVFSVGLPLTILVGGVLMPILVLPALPARMAMMWSEAYNTIGSLLGTPGIGG